jgi:tetratricopeptide (TPR) repeat protein
VRSAAKLLLLVALALWVYHPALHGTWLWDDGLEVTRNALLRNPDGWWRAWIDPGGMDYFPLKSTLQWVEWQAWGADPYGYHAVNLALHVASALLVWRLLARIGVRSAFLGGLLFAVHPVAVESVAWVSEFKNTASLPFLLLSCLLYLDHVGTGRRGPWIGSIACFAASLACKTSGVMLPFMLLAYAWWASGRVGRRDLVRTAPFFAASAAMGAATLWFQSHRAIGPSGTLDPILARVGEAGWSLAAYTRQCLWPSGLEPIYPRVGAGILSILPWLGLAVVLAFLCRHRAGWGRHGLLAAGWFYLNLAPACGILPMAYLRIAPRADHFAYISLVAAAGMGAALLDMGLAAAPGLPRAWLAEGAGRLGWFLAASGVAVLAVESRAYAGVFRDEKSLWECAVGRDPGAWLARSNLGKAYLEEGRAAEAATQLAEAVRLEPDSPEAHANLGNALDAMGRADAARIQYLLALQIDPRMAGAHYDLGLSLMKSGETARAEAEFRGALALDPSRAKARNNLGLCLAREGRTPEAVREFQLALGLDPLLREAYLNLGNVYFREGRYADAALQFREAIRADPGYGAAHYNLGLALGRLGMSRDSEAEFGEARRLGNR